MTPLCRHLFSVLLLTTVAPLPAMADDRTGFPSSGPGPAATIQSLDLRAGQILIDGRAYRLAPTLKVYAPNGRQVDPVILQRERHIRFTTTPGTAVVTEIHIVQAD